MTMKRLEYIKNKWPVISLSVLYMYLVFHAISGSAGHHRLSRNTKKKLKLQKRHFT